MRVLLVHKFFHLTGGAEMFFFETARVLEERGHEVAFFSTVDERNRTTPYESYFVEAPDYRQGSLLGRIGAIGKIVYSVETKEKFLRLLKDFKPDIVHVFAMFTHLSPSLLDACREMKVPVVMSCNDYKHICPNYKLFHHGRLCEDCKGARLYKPILNRCCQESLAFSIASCLESSVHYSLNILKKNVHTFLFASEFMARKTEEFWGKGTFRWAKLMNPFDSTKYCASYASSEYLLFFGRLVEEKGVDILLKAMKGVPEARLVLVGDGPQKEKMQQLSSRLRLDNVEFAGPQWGDKLDDILINTRFVVIPSVWHENFPYVIVQSFAMGKAVIGTDRGGIPELIKDGEYGRIYPAEDPDVLAERIRELWLDPRLAVEMGKNAKEYADSVFNDRVFYQTLMGIYGDVVK